MADAKKEALAMQESIAVLAPAAEGFERKEISSEGYSGNQACRQSIDIIVGTTNIPIQEDKPARSQNEVRELSSSLGHTQNPDSTHSSGSAAQKPIARFLALTVGTLV